MTVTTTVSIDHQKIIMHAQLRCSPSL